MSVTDPAPFLQDMDVDFFRKYKNPPSIQVPAVKYVEPQVGQVAAPKATTEKADDVENAQQPTDSGKIQSKVVVLGDFIDTDAVCTSGCLLHIRH